MGGGIDPQYGVNTNAPYLNNPPQQLLDIIAEFHKSGKSDSQILAILVGMGTHQQLAISGINAFKAGMNMYNENNNKQKNHNKMNFTLAELYENVMKSINGLKEMESDNSRVSYSAKTALNILESSLANFPMRFKNEDVAVISEEIENSVNPTLKFKIAKNLHNSLSASDWLNPVRELRSYIAGTYADSKWSYKIAEAVERNSSQRGKLYEGLTSELNALLSESSDTVKTKVAMVASKHPWSNDLKNIVNEMASDERKATANNSGKIVSVLSPVLENENGLTFHLHGKNYTFNGKEITETTVNDSRFFDVLEGLGMFKRTNNSLVTFSENGKTLEFNLTEGTLKLGDVDLTNSSIIELKEALLATSFFGYRDQWKTDKVCRFFESVDMLAEMDNFTNIASTDFANLFLTMIAVQDPAAGLWEGVWVNKVNSGMQLNEMVFVPTATETVKLVKEFINYDASPILSERLIAEGNEKAASEKKRAEINDKISFLEEKKAKVAEAVKKVGETEELKEAMNLLDSEISKFEKELQETFSVVEKKTKDEYLNDGYVEAEVVKTSGGLRKGDEVLVNAEEYTSLGDDDLLNVVDPKTDKSKIVKKEILKVQI
jgi:hypothetical protein